MEQVHTASVDLGFSVIGRSARLDDGPASTVPRCRPRRRSQLSALVMPTGYSGDTGLPSVSLEAEI
jgi:hypothetical protein